MIVLWHVMLPSHAPQIVPNCDGDYWKNETEHLEENVESCETEREKPRKIKKKSGFFPMLKMNFFLKMIKFLSLCVFVVFLKLLFLYMPFVWIRVSTHEFQPFEWKRLTGGGHVVYKHLKKMYYYWGSRCCSRRSISLWTFSAEEDEWIGPITTYLQYPCKRREKEPNVSSFWCPNV